MNPCRCCGQDAYSGSVGGRNLCVWCDTGSARPVDVQACMIDPRPNLAELERQLAVAVKALRKIADWNRFSGSMPTAQSRAMSVRISEAALSEIGGEAAARDEEDRSPRCPDCGNVLQKSTAPLYPEGRRCRAWLCGCDVSEEASYAD